MQGTVAVGQIESVREPEANLAKISPMVQEAEVRGADVVVFPEYAMSWRKGSHADHMEGVAQPLTGPFVTEVTELARSHQIWVVVGMIEKNPHGGLPYNTIIVVDNAGRLAASYRKSHLFDAFGRKESDSFSRGDCLFNPVSLPIGVCGLLVCYELRFPEVSRFAAVRGADVLLVPSAWVAGPLKDRHWRTLLRSRAIENGCYVIAAAQTGNDFCGQSAIVDPHGVEIAQAGVEETLLMATISKERLSEVRRQVPSLGHRREELYLSESAR